MAKTSAKELRFDAGAGDVSARLDAPRDAWAGYVFAHGAGAGMRHPFMQSVAEGLTARGIAVLRYQFPHMEAGSGRPDRPPVAHAAVRAAVAAAAKALPKIPLIAGGKSFGGRMTSQAQALEKLQGVVGLAFFGFPLHAAGKPSDERAAHLADVRVPMLFLQGTRDAFADLDLLRPIVKKLGKKAVLDLTEGGDHSFKVPAASGRKPADVMDALLDSFTEWARRVSGD
jgi:predicted alpha/beta-hydrolase family hydrolase